jgi:K+-transporting ATPase ATPase C chain
MLTLCVCCVAYPAALLAFAQAVTPWTADGSLVEDGSGTVVGSIQVAQGFTRPDYFWPRPSAVDYNASATGGSNLSPANPALAERARQLIDRYGVQNQSIPAELVSSSGSGIDPHITLRAAMFQVPRVSVHRAIPEEHVHDLIFNVAEYPSLVPVGDRLVNVLKLNLALDALRENAKR